MAYRTGGRWYHSQKQVMVEEDRTGAGGGGGGGAGDSGRFRRRIMTRTSDLPKLSFSETSNLAMQVYIRT